MCGDEWRSFDDVRRGAGERKGRRGGELERMHEIGLQIGPAKEGE